MFTVARAQWYVHWVKVVGPLLVHREQAALTARIPFGKDSAGTDPESGVRRPELDMG